MTQNDDIRNFLAKGESSAVGQDAGIDWTTDTKVQQTLEEHDRRFHPNGYNPKTDTCRFRERLARGDLADSFLDDIKIEAEADEENINGMLPTPKGVKFSQVVEGGFSPKAGGEEESYPVRITDIDSGESYVANSPRECHDPHDAHVYKLVKEHGGDDIQLGHTLGQMVPQANGGANPENAYHMAKGDTLLRHVNDGDPVAQTLYEGSGALNSLAGWGFTNRQVRDYVQAFRDMDDNKFPYGLPEFAGKLNEGNFNSIDVDKVYGKKMAKIVQALAANPNLIRLFVLERLEDANFHKEVKALEDGDYAKVENWYKD